MLDLWKSRVMTYRKIIQKKMGKRRRATNMLKVLRIDTNASMLACEKRAGDHVSEGDGVSVGGMSHSMGKSNRCCVGAELGESSLTASTDFLVSAACTI